MYNLKLDGFWYHLRGNKKTREIFNFSLKSNRNAPLSIILNTQICLLFAGYSKGDHDKTLSSQRPLCVVWRLERKKAKESTWGTMGREKRGPYHMMCGSLARFVLWFSPSQLTIWIFLDAVVKIIV